ncbi:2'-5' RNA ligase family protein [Salinibaculum rarum]|uniref:2'-5' RNA ligase family protein n=1 Tax=Salinibaculum rarum TaxID=3058903 RepID=UPI00265F0580|nr:2'-5' RNA ligase family protein [Salinibaculum sp. KK48]
MYSLNVPPPSEVTALAQSLARDLPMARARARGEHTLVAKRLRVDDRTDFHPAAARVRDALAGTPTFEVKTDGIGYFSEDPVGPSPVVYLAIESPELYRLHRRLCEIIDPVENFEGDDYTPHVTIARGGDIDAAERLVERGVDPVTWTVTELQFWDAKRSLAAGTVSLPA